MNRYAWWQYAVVAVVLLIGTLYALPNVFGEDPAVQVSAVRGSEVDAELRGRVEDVLSEQGIPYADIELGPDRLLVRFTDTETQLRAADYLAAALGGDYTTALNLAPATPQWLQTLNIRPMFLGLDLRGGVHFLMEVDMDAALGQAVARYADELRGLLRDKRLRYTGVDTGTRGVSFSFRDAETRDAAREAIEEEYPRLELDVPQEARGAALRARLSEEEAREIRDLAVEQNITALRNRVNELGVAEPVIQQQGNSRIVVQLPGVQDTAQAKRILGATATLEYREVDIEHDPLQAAETGRIPPGSELLRARDGRPVLLKKRVIVTGDQIVNARAGFDQTNGSPMVSVTLDGKGARKMLNFTKEHVGDPMAVVFIENKTFTEMVDGEPVVRNRKVEEVINVATIRDVFSKKFQTTGLDSPQEAHELALLLRAGALAAPIRIVEERTVGPSLGQENINQGFQSVIIGLSLVLVFMAVYYRVFGLVADLALAVNLVLIVAILSMLQATLTLPGIAGIVLTVGMAVDANVLIFERIREEIKNGNSPQASIHSGYAKALSTIADANITTLIAAVVLFSFGTGPIKGFAVTLCIGILTSMFTAIMGTRAVINLIYGGRRGVRLAI